MKNQGCVYIHELFGVCRNVTFGYLNLWFVHFLLCVCTRVCVCMCSAAVAVCVLHRPGTDLGGVCFVEAKT